jgi:enterochelin esterase-like enzyme
MRRAVGIACALAIVAAAPGAIRAAAEPPLPGSFAQIGAGPAGGTLWQGLVPNHEVAGTWRPTVVYLPPGFSRSRRYPVVYLLQGFRGSPYEYVDGVDIAGTADRLISAGTLPPFIAVIPPAGLTPRFAGEWTGVWENDLIRDVVPWADRNLPTVATAAGRTLAGLSAGGFGAADIGLRHPGLFGTLESWSGSFTAPHDGSLAHADAAERAAHDPSLLLQREAPLLRRLGMRLFLSAGKDDHADLEAAWNFAAESAALRVPHRLWLGPGGHDGRFWRAQLATALEYALRPPGYASVSPPSATSRWPVTNLASSDARKTTAPATSRGRST